LLFFTKHNYGVLALAGVGLDGLVSLVVAAVRRHPGELRREIWSYLLLGCSVAVPVLVWVRAASLRRVYDTMHWELVDQFVALDLGRGPYGEGLVNSLGLLRDSYFVSPALGWCALLALLLSFSLFEERRLRAIALVTIASLLLIPTSPLIQPRYLIAAVPPLLGLAVLVPARMFRRGSLHRLAAVVLVAGSAVGLVASWRNLVDLPDRVVAAAAPTNGYVWRSAFGDTGPANLVDVVDFVRINVPLQRSVATMVRTGFLSPYVWKLELHDWGAPVWTSNEFDDPRMPAADYFVALDFGDAFPYQDDIRGENRSTNSQRWSAYLTARNQEGSVVIEAEREFPTVATKVLIYRSVGSSNIPLPQFLPPMKL
jgi:hypothetical protein